MCEAVTTATTTYEVPVERMRAQQTKHIRNLKITDDNDTNRDENADKPASYSSRGAYTIGRTNASLLYLYGTIIVFICVCR